MSPLAADWTQETRFARVIVAVLAAAVLGAAYETGWYLLNLYNVNGAEHFAKYAIEKAKFIFVISCVSWLIALVFFGLPVWFALHKRGLRRWQHAVLVGILVPFIVVLAISTGLFTGRSGGNWSYYAAGGQQWENGILLPFGWSVALKSAAHSALFGACLALVIWRISYVRIERL